MNRKLKSTLGLLGLLALILIGGGIYIFGVQKNAINKRMAKLKELNSYNYNTAQLTAQYEDLLKKAGVLDSVLDARKFNIPQNLNSIRFYNFTNQVTSTLSQDTHVDIEYLGSKQDREFFYYEYKVTGIGPYNDIFRLIYSIEQSKELKKIKNITMSNQIATNKEGIPKFVVNFTGTVDVYYSTDNRFSTSTLLENDLRTKLQQDLFYPLIRTQIPPNTEDLLDVQGAKLLALIPEGAFLADTKGNTYLLWEGEQVYLGYLTKIDYDHNIVSFILNKGGIIEKVDLNLEREANKNIK